MTKRKTRRGGFIDAKGRPELIAAPWFAKGSAGYRIVSKPGEDNSDDKPSDDE